MVGKPAVGKSLVLCCGQAPTPNKGGRIDSTGTVPFGWWLANQVRFKAEILLGLPKKGPREETWGYLQCYSETKMERRWGSEVLAGKSAA